MVSVEPTKSDEQNQKDKLLSSLGYAKWVPRIILVPTLFYKKIVVLYETVFKDSTTITAFTSFIMQVGLDLFWKLKQRYGVKSFAEFLRIREFLFNNLNDLMVLYYKEQSITTLENINECLSIFHNKTDKERLEFIEFVKKYKHKVMGNRIHLKSKDLIILNKVFKRMMSKNVYRKVPKRS